MGLRSVVSYRNYIQNPVRMASPFLTSQLEKYYEKALPSQRDQIGFLDFHKKILEIFEDSRLSPVEKILSLINYAGFDYYTDPIIMDYLTTNELTLEEMSRLVIRCFINLSRQSSLVSNLIALVKARGETFCSSYYLFALGKLIPPKLEEFVKAINTKNPTAYYRQIFSCCPGLYSNPQRWKHFSCYEAFSKDPTIVMNMLTLGYGKAASGLIEQHGDTYPPYRRAEIVQYYHREGSVPLTTFFQADLPPPVDLVNELWGTFDIPEISENRLIELSKTRSYSPWELEEALFTVLRRILELRFYRPRNEEEYERFPKILIEKFGARTKRDSPLVKYLSEVNFDGKWHDYVLASALEA